MQTTWETVKETTSCLVISKQENVKKTQTYLS